MINWRASSQSSNQNVSNPQIKQLLNIFCWLHIFHPRHICSLAPRTSSSVPVILIDSPPNLIGLTWELISSPLPLSVFHQTTDAVARRGTHTREFSAWPSARSCSSLSLSALILHPTTPTSRCYLGWQNTQGLSLLLLLCSDIPVWSISVPASLCFQQSATDVSLFAKQMRAVSDVDSAEELNLNNASTLFFFFFTPPDYVSHLNRSFSQRSGNKTMDVWWWVFKFAAPLFSNWESLQWWDVIFTYKSN